MSVLSRADEGISQAFLKSCLQNSGEGGAMCKTNEQETKGKNDDKDTTQNINKIKKDQRSLLKHSTSFRPENKFLRPGFPASSCCRPQNVHAAEAWEEYFAQ